MSQLPIELQILQAVYHHEGAIYRNQEGKLHCRGLGVGIDSRLTIKLIWQLTREGLIERRIQYRDPLMANFHRVPKSYTLYSISELGKKVLEESGT